ncbi:hypothetical protein A5782_02740 [Mycobacterium sp. 852002-40037_SCH5390672]|nr:hypothetical protein A5782_02740 [Mycobacterium sp. 852002-40037_SCH5390672]
MSTGGGQVDLVMGSTHVVGDEWLEALRPQLATTRPMRLNLDRRQQADLTMLDSLYDWAAEH